MANNNPPNTIYSSSLSNSEDKKSSNTSLRQQQLQNASNNYYTTNTSASSVSYNMQNPQRPHSSAGTNASPEMYQYEYEPTTSNYYSNSQYHQEASNIPQQYNNQIQQNIAVDQRYYQPQQHMYHQSTPDSNYSTGTTNVNSTSQLMQQHHQPQYHQQQHPMMEEVVEEEVEVDQQEYYITPTSVQQHDRVHQPHQYQNHSSPHQMIPQSRYPGEGFPVYLPSARQQIQQHPPNAYRRANSNELYSIPGSYIPQHNVPMEDNVVSSPPPVENEVDVYDFSPNVESMETISPSDTSGEYGSQSSMQLPNSYRKITPPKMPPATTIINAEHAKHEHRLKMKHVASAVPQFEEEEDEEELESDANAKTTGPLISPSRRQAQQVHADEKSVVKRNRKQQLPTDSKEAIIVKTPSPRKKNASGTGTEKTIKSTTSKQETVRAVDKEATSSAHAQAIQRIATMEGWKRMNEWLKTAERAKNVSKLKSLLAQCNEANVDTKLLLSNDTPRFVMQLSKSSNDKDICEMAAKLVAKWKKIVKANKDVSVEKASTISVDVKKEKSGNNNISKGSNLNVPSENKKEHVSELPKKEKVVSAATVTSGSASSGTTSTATTSSTAAKIRPKAKAKISKPRSTGLEGDGDEIIAAAPVKKKQTPTQQQQPATFDNSILGDILAASTLPPKIQAKRSVMLSDSFMDALEDKAVAPKRPKIVRKKLTPSQPSKPAPSAETQKPQKTPSPTQMEQAANTTIEEQNFARRKVRFADEKGSELVAVRFFEIEQGERVNVTRMSSEDMKHFEMQRERTFIREQKGFHFLPSNLPMPQGFGGMSSGFHYQHQQKQSAHRWKLIKVDNISEMIEPGCNSEMKHIELRRQATVMEAFYDSFTSLQVSEIDEEDKPRVSGDYAPKLIPLEAVTFGDDDSLQSSGGSDTNNNGNGNVAAAVIATSTTSSAIGSLPLPFTSASLPSALLTTTTAASIPSNLSRLASQLPPAVAALVSGMHSAGDTVNLVDSGKSLDNGDAKSGLDDDLESPRSPDAVSASLTKKAIKTMEDDDEFEFSLRSPGDDNNDDDVSSVLGPPDSPDDTDIRSLSDQEMEDKDIRQTICSGDSRTRAGSDVRMDYEDEDTDIRFGQLGNIKLIPSTPVTASSPITASKPTSIKSDIESGGGVSATASKSSGSSDMKMDADGLKSMMDSLKKSGLMSSTNLASILGKVQNIGSIGKSTSSVSSSSLAGNMSFSGIVDAPAAVSMAATTVSAESMSVTSNIVPSTNTSTTAPYDQAYGVGGVHPPPPSSGFGTQPPFMPQQRGVGAMPTMFPPRAPPNRYSIMPPRGGVLPPHLQSPQFRGRFPPPPRVRPAPSTYGPGGTLGFFGSPTTALSISGYHASPSRVNDGDGGSSFFNPPPVTTRTNANNALPSLSPPRLLQSIPVPVRSTASSSGEKSDVVAQSSKIDNNTTHNVTALSFDDEDANCRKNDSKVGSGGGGKANTCNTTNPVAENKTSFSNVTTTNITNTDAATYSSTHFPSSFTTFSIPTLPGGVPTISGDSSDSSIQPPGTEETAAEADKKEVDKKQPDDFNSLMPLARTFVKQCTYYMSGGCHFGEGCRFAHGDEITLGLRQAVVAIRNGYAGGSGGVFRGGGRGFHHGGHHPTYPPRGGGGPIVSAVGGGVELDYDSSENRIRTWKVPPTHIMVTDSNPISRGGGRGRRFSPPFRRGYDNRYGGRQRRSRSRTSSISPVRTRRSGGDEISHSRSRSPRGSRSSHRSRGGDSRSPDHHHRGKTSRRRRSHSSSSRDSRSDEKRRMEGGSSWKKYSSSRYGTSSGKRTSSSHRAHSRSSSSSSSSTTGSSTADVDKLSAKKRQTGNRQRSASPPMYRRRQRSNSNSSSNSNDDDDHRMRSTVGRSDRETGRHSEKPSDVGRRMKDDESEEDGGTDSARLKSTKVESNESPSSSSSETRIGGGAEVEEKS